MENTSVEKEMSRPTDDVSSGANTTASTGEEKEIYLRPQGPRAAALTPVSSRPGDNRSSLNRVRSYVDGHGYFSDDGRDDGQDAGQEVDVEGDPEKAFEVQWDGPDDPMNPKNISTARKWLIVIILAFGSLCVTCTSSLYTLTYGLSALSCRIFVPGLI